MEKNLKNVLVVFSLIVLALFVASCAPQLDPEGNPLPKEALAGQAVYVSVSNDMLKSGVKLDQKFNTMILSPEVESVNPVDFFASVSSDLSYAMDQKSKQVYMPGKKVLPKGYSSMNLVKPGIKYIVYMKKPGTLVYPASVVAQVPAAPLVDLSKCKEGQAEGASWKKGPSWGNYYDYNLDGFIGRNDHKILVMLLQKKLDENIVCRLGLKCDVDANGKIDINDPQAFVVKFQDCINAAEADSSLEKPICIPGPTGVFKTCVQTGAKFYAEKEIQNLFCEKSLNYDKCGFSADSCVDGKGCVPVCTDSDGKNPSVKGTTVDEAGKSWSDSCDSTTSVLEYFCSDTQVGGKNMDNDVVQCGNGEECKDGACVKKAAVFSCGSDKNTVTNSTVSDFSCASKAYSCRTDNTTFAACMTIDDYKY